MMQSGGLLVDLAIGLLEVPFRTEIEAAKRGTSILPKNATNYFVNKKINELNGEFTTTKGSGVPQTKFL